MSAEKKKCAGRVWDGWRFVACSCNARYVEDGAHYCGTHQPSAIKEREAMRRSRDEAKSRGYEAVARINNAERAIVAAVLREPFDLDAVLVARTHRLDLDSPQSALSPASLDQKRP